jgi:nuclear pore complex protein Nup37
MDEVFRRTLNGRATAIAWSPESSLNQYDSVDTLHVKLALATTKHSIYIIWLDKMSIYTEAHTDFINDMAWCISQPNILATVSDDRSCRIWDTTQGLELIRSISLGSPGVVLRWHPNNAYHLMIAERQGYLRLLNYTTQLQPNDQGWRLTLQVPCRDGHLTGADWHPGDYHM